MLPVRLRLSPGWDENHSQLTISLHLPRVLHSLELLDLCWAVNAWTGRKTRVVLPADAPCGWLDEWSVAIDEALIGPVEVEFVMPRLRRPIRLPLETGSVRQTDHPQVSRQRSPRESKGRRTDF